VIPSEKQYDDNVTPEIDLEEFVVDFLNGLEQIPTNNR
jgi:hypothetical protein